MPKELYEQLKQEAEEYGLKLAEFVRMLLYVRGKAKGSLNETRGSSRLFAPQIMEKIKNDKLKGFKHKKVEKNEKVN